MAHLQPWVEDWPMPEMFAGVEGQGTEDAAYSASLFLERCQLRGMEFTGGAVDISNLFDQVQRELLYKLLEEAVMPKGIVEPTGDYERE